MIKNLQSAAISPIGLYINGLRAKKQADQSRETTKLHVLRGGTAGCYVPSMNAFVGANPREALGRFMGYQLKKSMESLLLFESGFASEAQFEANVKVCGIDYRRDEQYPIHVPNWSGEYSLSGRPDGVIFKDNIPQFGIELKCIVSESSAQEVMVKRTPKLDNVCQAVRYSMATGLPWVLVYTNLARQGKWGNVVKVGHVEFFISIRNGEVWIEDEIGERKTIITTQGIKDYDDALVYAYTNRDISILDWGDVGVFGDETKYDGRTYNNWEMMVSANQSFDNWEASAKVASQSDYLINYKSKAPNYTITHIESEEILHEFKTLEEARKMLTEILQNERIKLGGES